MSANNPSSQLHDPDYDVAVRDPEAAARGLALVQQLLDEGEDAADRKDLKVGEEIKKELRDTLSELHPADIAYILEALPLDERLIVWDCVRSGRDGEILVEVNEGVRETLIDAMNRDELVDAVESLDTDEIADLVEDLPPDVVAEVQEGLSHEERAQLRAAMSYPEDTVDGRIGCLVIGEGAVDVSVFHPTQPVDVVLDLRRFHVSTSSVSVSPSSVSSNWSRKRAVCSPTRAGYL